MRGRDLYNFLTTDDTDKDRNDSNYEEDMDKAPDGEIRNEADQPEYE